MNMFGYLWRERPLDGACPPPNTRRLNFYLTARSHDTKCDYVASYDGDQRRIDPVKTLGVSLTSLSWRKATFLPSRRLARLLSTAFRLAAATSLTSCKPSAIAPRRWASIRAARRTRRRNCTQQASRPCHNRPSPDQQHQHILSPPQILSVGFWEDSAMTPI
jgi:hypothetical protein